MKAVATTTTIKFILQHVITTQTEMAAVQVPQHFQVVDEATFAEEIYSKRRPAVLKNFEFGNAKTLWTVEYLAKTIGSSPVKIHVSPTSKMDFLKKNFQYKLVRTKFCNFYDLNFI